MRTRKLYEDAYIKTHRAKVLGFHESGALVLDETIFYPEGGGQLADEGYISGVRVLDVQEEGDLVLHYLESYDEFFIGREVDLDINWQFRFDNMQQHTGEHILSGIAKELFGTKNVGFEIGRDMMRVDYDRELSWQELEDLERKTNEAISRNTPIVSFFPRPEVLESLPYRSKKVIEGDIRIVEVKGYDICACKGTHVRQTGEVGLLKILSRENYKGGVRLGILCGFKALEYFHKLVWQSHEISTSLCAPVLDLIPALNQVFEDRESIKKQLILKDEELIRLKLETMEPQGNLIIFEDVLRGKSLKIYMAELMVDRQGSLAIFSPEEDGYSFNFITSAGDISKLGKDFLAAFDGKGGGRGESFQGFIPVGQDQDDMRKRIEEWLEKYIQQ